MEDKVVTLELSVNEINLILASMAKQPLETVLNTYLKIKNSAEEQLNKSTVEG